MRIAHIVFASAWCAALAACESPSTGLDEHDLAMAAQQIESTAGEARWLAQQLEAREVNSGMAWVHQQALAKDTLKVARDLAKPVPDALRGKHEQLGALNMQLRSRVDRIASSAGNRNELESLQRDFDATAEAAHPLGRQG